MTIPRDFVFNREAIVHYYENLIEFDGIEITQREIATILKNRHPSLSIYNSLDRKFATLKFYGFIYEDGRSIRLNPYYGNYVNSLKRGDEVIDSFMKVLGASKFQYYRDKNDNFFQIIIELITDKEISYVDLIELIWFVQNLDFYETLNDLKKDMLKWRVLNFFDRADALESFYTKHGLGSLGAPVHEAKTYLFSFLEANGFKTLKNSLVEKKYYQGATTRVLSDIRLVISEDLRNLINGFDLENIQWDLEYNSSQERDHYDFRDVGAVRIVEKSSQSSLSVSRRYKTDPKLRNTALVKSAHTCELGKAKGEYHKTFTARRTDHDYMEVHHLVPIHAQEHEKLIKEDKLISLDQISNLVVLCPNCHRRIHYGSSEAVSRDVSILYSLRQNDLLDQSITINEDDLFELYNVKPF